MRMGNKTDRAERSGWGGRMLFKKLTPLSDEWKGLLQILTKKDFSG
jgi:hypothetical protein